MLLLFDVDGVLVENRAYREAIRRGTAYFGERLGLGRIQPTDEDVDVFESQSITVEWDTTAMTAALLLLERLRRDADSDGAALAGLPPDVWRALDALPPRTDAEPAPAPDFAGLARRVGEAARASGQLPALAALRLLRQDLAQRNHLPAERVLPLLEHLLGQVYDIERSPAMQIFQNLVLGHAAYAEYYGLPPRLESPPLLEQLDRPLLSPAHRDRLLAARAEGRAYPVIYTARPSLAPVEAGPHHRGYTPESEMARTLVGLEGIPVMGFGKLEWVARRVGRAGSDLVKPSPVQALAALGAARTGLEVEAVKAALAVERGDHVRYPLTACAGQHVHVFEDSPSSLRAVTRAVELLNRRGLGLGLTRHGIAAPASPKRDTLAEVADALHDDVNAAVEAVLG